MYAIFFTLLFIQLALAIFGEKRPKIPTNGL